MIVALPARKDGLGMTRLALHLAGGWVREGKRIGLVDGHPHECAPARPEKRRREVWSRLFGVIGPACDTRHRETPQLTWDADQIVVDGPPRVAALIRPASVAADLADMLRALLAHEAPDHVGAMP